MYTRTIDMTPMCLLNYIYLLVEYLVWLCTSSEG